jgi:hypothetical protein
MKLKHLALAVVMMTAAAGASAQVYGELDYQFVNYEDSDMPDVNIGLLGANLGYEINRNLAVEARAAFGVMDDDFTVAGINVNAKLDRSFGFYIKPKFSPAPNLELYGKLGYMDTRMKFSLLGDNFKDSDGDLAYGFGAQYDFAKKGYITGGYSRFYDDDGAKLGGWHLGLGYKF